MLRNLSLRALAVGALVAATGCSRDVDFTITKTFDPVNSAGSGAVYTYTEDVDMAAEAGSAWKHRDKIKKLELVGLDGTMTRNITGHATTGSGSIVLKRTGHSDATVGTWTNHAIPASGPDSIGVVLDASGVGLVENALRNDGKFSVTFNGSTAAPVQLAADVALHFKLTFKYP